MRATALRLYGAGDLRLETFDLPPIADDEILVKIISDSLCMSSYKAASQGTAHKRVPADAGTHPVILGHEFSAEILEAGSSRAAAFKPGQRVTLQPSLKGSYDAAGYSFRYLGGNMTYGIVPARYIDQGNLLPFTGEAAFHASLAEPLSCVIGAAHACYHTTNEDYIHRMDIKPGGKAAALAATGPMGLALIDYLIHRDIRPSMLTVTDIDPARLERAARVLSREEAARGGVDLRYVNTRDMSNPAEYLRGLTGGEGYDEAFVFAPVTQVIEQADAILAYSGCLNFFAGPTDAGFSARFNFYNVHYNQTHVVGTSGGNTDDLREALDMASRGLINPALLVTHVGGLNAARDATLNLPRVPGGKKLIYNHIELPLTAIDDFERLGRDDPLFAKLAELCAGGLWNLEAERYLLKHAPALDADKYA
ncbi:MAG: zinc-binding dehydrogenase [Oscillospiraceae bacterium]|jgi:threonine dehydrogenase-like Zn-dependent dehydrogenase|nr:zinc-binding dehydrogenase [Oscillospiraceae bacterium]